MPSFKDVNGKEWHVKIDGPKICDVRQALNFDLAMQDHRQLFQALDSDVTLLVNILWVLCRDQAGSTTDRQFGEALNGDAIGAATEALIDAIADFIPPRKRGLFQQMVVTQRQAHDSAIKSAMDKIKSPELMDAIKQTVMDRMDDDIKDALTRLRSASSSPESLA